MGLEARLSLKMSQGLLMTPQLQQAIKLLQLGRLEYQEALEHELLENPILEEEHDVQTSSSALSNEENALESPSLLGAESEKPEKWEEFFDNIFSESRDNVPAAQNNSADFSERPSLEATLSRPESLHDYLLKQVRLVDYEKEDEALIQYIIGNIDRDGYLCVTTEEVTQATMCSPTQLERVLHLVHRLDPSGIGARDLKECLLLQLDDLGLGDSLAARIVARHLDKIESRKIELIVKAEQCEQSAIIAAINTIRELEPKPGRPFADDETRYAVPDIFISKVGNDFVVTLNEDGIPRLRINTEYLDLLKKEVAEGTGDKTYITDRLKAAQFLIKSIHQRQSTISKVAHSLVKFQRDFFDKGVAFLRPLTLKEVADDIGMHESTVSRVTTNKFTHSPQGVFELKYFFTTGVKGANGDISSSSVKERIKQIIESENTDSPVSDQQIVDILTKEGTEVARRTVAKYRESLGLLASSQRKKLF